MESDFCYRCDSPSTARVSLNSTLHYVGSLSVVALLASVHLTIGKWTILQGPNTSRWLSVSAGTALAYVFAYLMPKLAVIQSQITAADYGWIPWMRNQAYLIALIGLLVYFTVSDRANAGVAADLANSRKRRNTAIALQLVGYSFYSIQLGYLVAHLPEPNIASYALVLIVLGLHLMGIDHHLHERFTRDYQNIIRYALAASIAAGWLIGALTDGFSLVLMLSTTFVAGGIIITAIREEMGHSDSTPGTFVCTVVAAVAAILIVQHVQAPLPH